jgi:hypothetical protein
MIKLLITVLLFTVLSSAHSEEKIEVPKMFVDSKIVVTLKDGKQFTFDGNEWMVVRRKAKKSIAILAPKNESKKENKVAKSEEKDNKNKNRIRLMGGIGPSGFDTTKRRNSVEVETTEDILGGVGYDRLITEEWSLGGQVLSNGTYTIGLGLDF